MLSSIATAQPQISQPLTNQILHQIPTYPPHIKEEQLAAKTSNKNLKHQQLKELASAILSSLPSPLQLDMSLAQEKGASTWLTSLPIEEFGFSLHKRAFRDALALRYGWPPLLVPTTCACGKSFNMEYILSCPIGGFPTIRHNEICDVTATLLYEVCHDVAVEPHLQFLEGKTSNATANSQDGAKLGIVASGIWGGRFERSFYDVRVFNPHAPSNQHPQMESTYYRHEALKRRTYEQ